MGGEVSAEGDKSGWRVLQVMKNSPCGDKGLITYFHVLTHVNGIRVTKAESSLFTLIQHGQLTKLSFVNFATGGRLEMEVVPNRNWGGDGLLGLVIRHQDMDNADLDTVHILDVYPGSPAASAGLIPYRDYLLGTSERAFRGWEELDWFLEKFDNTPAQMYVFNSSTFQVREVTITPSKSWGGKGSLGCDVGIGYLHRLPLDQKEGHTSTSNSSSRLIEPTPSVVAPGPFTNVVPSLSPRPIAEQPVALNHADRTKTPLSFPQTAPPVSSYSQAPPGVQLAYGFPSSVPSSNAPPSNFPQSLPTNFSQPVTSFSPSPFPGAYAAFQPLPRPGMQFQPAVAPTQSQLPPQS